MSTAARPTVFDEFLLLLGRLNYTWTNTESLLIHLIAGLAGTGKETAVIIYLTLNTTRARVDLVERLAKMDNRQTSERDRVLEVTRTLSKLSGLRNRYNHCIFAFDAEGGSPQTIMMRIADRRDDIKVGKTSNIDDDALAEIRTSIEDLSRLNLSVWSLIRDHGYPI